MVEPQYEPVVCFFNLYTMFPKGTKYFNIITLNC